MSALSPLLPIRFDENEIYTIVIFIIVVITILALPKRFPASLVYFIFLLNIFLSGFGDYILAGGPYDFYDTIDADYFEFFDIPIHLVVYPGYFYIVLYAYDKYFREHKIAFGLFGVALTTFLEWISVQYFHLFTYKEWNLALSTFVYFLAVLINMVAFELARKARGIRG